MENDKDFSYLESLEYCLNIFKKNNNNLLLFINQIYIVSEFIQINKIFKINQKYEKNIIKEILGLLKDYFNSFLKKYYKEKNDYNYEIEYDLILLLLSIRYNKYNELVRNILEEESSKITKILKQFIISINWIESNRNTIILLKKEEIQNIQ